MEERKEEMIALKITEEEDDMTWQEWLEENKQLKE